MVQRDDMEKSRLFIIGIILMALGAITAWLVQTAGGIRIQDVRFTGTNGTPMSGLLYIPANATSKTPAPGVLAVHGYINSREAHSAFAIEFARRGYVVLALDQTGHGYSGPPAFGNGFGGPDGLKYLRSLDIVDKSNIGLEGHSMGGWTVLAAAVSAPDDYKSLVLTGSSTGKPFAAEGTTTHPRNLALVFSRYDEFSQFMWGVPKGSEVALSPKLWKVFGTEAAIEPGKVYGSIDNGTARILFIPAGTHPQNHILWEPVGHSLDWFGRTLKGGTPRPSSDQIWHWKEFGTLVALVGFIVLLLGAFDLLLRGPAFAALAQEPQVVRDGRDGRWWLGFVLAVLVPAALYYPVLALGAAWLPASRLLPQGITNQIALWATLNGLVALGIAFVLMREKPRFTSKIVPSIAIALATVGIGYLAVLAADFLFKIDFRFWFVAFKLMSPTQFLYSLVYLIPFTFFFLAAFRALHGGLAVKNDGLLAQYAVNMAAMALGFAILLAIQYGAVFATGALINPTANSIVALNTIVAIQFLPLLMLMALIATFTFRRTNSYVPGALICGLLVTWYIVAGQATHAAV
jgi:pimeloyl-ACP methyl ester carboxylesterase